MSTAPWWATGVFTLAGVGIAQLVAFALNRSRDRFEDSRRWHEDRRDIYLCPCVPPGLPHMWPVRCPTASHRADSSPSDPCSQNTPGLLATVAHLEPILTRIRWDRPVPGPVVVTIGGQLAALLLDANCRRERPLHALPGRYIVLSGPG